MSIQTEFKNDLEVIYFCRDVLGQFGVHAKPEAIRVVIERVMDTRSNHTEKDFRREWVPDGYRTDGRKPR